MRDVLFIFGLTLVFAGSWWVYPPAALIVVGSVLCVLAFVGAWHGPAGSASPTKRE